MTPTNIRRCQVIGCSFGKDDLAYKMMEGLLTQKNILKGNDLHMMVHLKVKDESNQRQKNFIDYNESQRL